MAKIVLNGHTFPCDDVQRGIAINPRLPAGFDATANDRRPSRHLAWVGVPYIVTDRGRIFVRRLDGGCWDRPTNLGECPSLPAAISSAAELVKYAPRYLMEFAEAIRRGSV